MTPFQITGDLLPASDHIPTFSTSGIGGMLASGFSRDFLSDRSQFPLLQRGKSLLLVADFGGHHQRQHFDTYTFLLLDIGKNADWLMQQRHFRQHILANRRRISFKTLNDGQRRRALVPFLRMAANIEGCLVQFAISKIGGSLFSGASEDETGGEMLKSWKPGVQERLLRVLHLSAFLLSGLSAPQQDLMWVIDEDDIAANVAMLTNLTNLFARVLSNYIGHTLGHIRCGTTANDDGSLAIEDLAAIADLTTGALGELCTSFIDQDMFPRKGLITPFPERLSWKTKLIGSWMAAPDFRIHRHTSVIELKPGTTKTRLTTLGWNSVPGRIIVPG